PLLAATSMEGKSATTSPVPGDAAGTAGGVGGASRGSEPISGNPAAVNIIAGTGALGRALGIGKDSGIRLGGLWLGEASGVPSAGKSRGGGGLNSLTRADWTLDPETIVGWRGGSLGPVFWQFAGQNTTGRGGAYPGFDSTGAGPPLTRNQLYQLWFR